MALSTPATPTLITTIATMSSTSDNPFSLRVMLESRLIKARPRGVPLPY
jgi:hypothetical protein